MFKITLGDVWRALIMAVLAAVAVSAFGVVGAVINQPNFDVFTVDFVQLFKDLTNACIIASYSSASAYILKNLLTDNKQDFLGIKTKS